MVCIQEKPLQVQNLSTFVFVQIVHPVNMMPKSCNLGQKHQLQGKGMQKHHVWLALVRLPNDANSRKAPGASGVASSNMLHPSLKLSTSIECTSGLFDGSRAIRIKSRFCHLSS
jgi:hypothetical protein